MRTSTQNARPRKASLYAAKLKRFDSVLASAAWRFAGEHTVASNSVPLAIDRTHAPSVPFLPSANAHKPFGLTMSWLLVNNSPSCGPQQLLVSSRGARYIITDSVMMSMMNRMTVRMARQRRCRSKLSSWNFECG